MTNRLADLESVVSRAHKFGRPPARKAAARAPQPRRPQGALERVRTAAPPVAPAPAAPAPAVAKGLGAKVRRWPLRGRLAGALGAVDYAIPGVFGPLAQPSANSCWATVFTMLTSWRRQQTLSIEDALQSVGQKWVDLYRADTGLAGDQKVAFLTAAGLVAEPPQNFSVEGWEQLLRNYGPIWVTTDEAPGKAWAIHARVITALRGDGTPENTHFTIVDPAGGRQYQESIAIFIPKYEEEVIRTGYTRIQVVHWSADARAEVRAQSFGRRIARAAGAQTAEPASEVASTVTQLRSRGVAEDEIRQFLQAIGVSYGFAMEAPPQGVTVTLPGGKVLSGWQSELLLAAIAAQLAAMNPPLAPVMVPLLRAVPAVADRFGVTIGIGPSIAGGLGAGASFGAGIMFAPGNRIGFYGSLSAVVGAIVSISATMQVTVVHGGPEIFGGTALAVTVGGGEVAVGAVSALLSEGKFIGVSFALGVGAGLSPIEAYAQYQYTPTTLGLAYSTAVGARV